MSRVVVRISGYLFAPDSDESEDSSMSQRALTVEAFTPL